MPKWRQRSIKPMTTKSKIILFTGILISASITAFLVFSSRNSDPKTHAIILTENGFKPSKITINTGDTITFSSKNEEYYWPASDLHPSHSIYSDFDPKEPIKAEDTWSFTFQKAGIWQFHDHLSPYYTGTITVEEKNSQTKTLDSCKDSADITCQKNEILSIFEKDGLTSAIENIEERTGKDPLFAQNCHTLTHELGKLAYQTYADGQEFEASPRASACAFGFYHGFMEQLFIHTNDLKQARLFCYELDKQLSKHSPDVGLQCFHGIGHGMVGNHDPLTWGSEEAMVEPALILCEDIASTDDELYRCISGVFNGIANFYTNGEYELKMNPDDPLWLCHKQPAKYQEACYGNMNVAVLSLNQNDFTKASTHYLNLPSSVTQASIRYLAAHNALLHLNQSDFFDTGIAECKALKGPLTQECLNGFAGGLIEHGDLTAGYLPPLAWCNHGGLTQEEKDICLNHAINYMKNWYSQSVFEQACDLPDTSKHHLCQ